MARLNSEARYGYYPTPRAALDLIAGSIEPPDRPGRIYMLDPCCGEGSALSDLAEALKKPGGPKIHTDGIEIQPARAGQARERLDRVFGHDLFSAQIAPASYDLILLNPPYRDRKLEIRFLTKVQSALAPGGLLIYIVPKLSVAAAAAQLASHYADIRLREFPAPESERFKQVVVTARKRSWLALDNSAERSRLEREARIPIGDPSAQYGEQDKRVLSLQLRTEPDVPTITADRFSTEALLAAAEERGHWADGSELRELIEPAAQSGLRPLAPLTEGHLAQYVAAGMVNNTIAGNLMFSGTCFKTPVRVESEDRIVTQDKLVMELVCLDLTTFRSHRLT